jgi:abortive infection bacteriophage resistance protein
MLDMLPMPLQTKISKNYTNLTSTPQLSAIIGLLVLFRNTCAHNDRLYNYTVNKGKLPYLQLHKKLGIPRLANGDCAYGKQDLFAVIIALRYLLEEDNFSRFFHKLEEIIKNHPDNESFPKIELVKSMGFPANWKDAAILPV